MRDIPCSRIGKLNFFFMLRRHMDQESSPGLLHMCILRLNIITMSILSKLISRFNITTIKISASYFVAITKSDSKVIWNVKDPE